MSQLAVYVCGPAWWGDPAVGSDGVPVRAQTDVARAARRDEMLRERQAIAWEVAALPDGCVVVHSGSPGAASRAAMTAAMRHLPMMAVPLTMEAEVVLALAKAGWKVKVLVFGVDENGEAEAMREGGVFVRVVDRPDPDLGDDPEEVPPQGS